MKKLTHCVAEKAYELNPEQWVNEEEALKEVTETFKDQDFNPFLEAISEWVFENYNIVPDTNLYY